MIENMYGSYATTKGLRHLASHKSGEVNLAYKAEQLLKEKKQRQK